MKELGFYLDILCMNVARKQFLIIFVLTIINYNAYSENTPLKFSPARSCTLLSVNSVVVGDSPSSSGLAFFMKKYNLWTDKEIKILKNNWPDSQIDDIIKLLPNRDATSIYNKSKKLKLTKSPSFKTKRKPKKTILTTEKYITRAIITHGNLYDYSSTKYIDWRTPVIIKCNKHKTFFKQKPFVHLYGSGCPKCAGNVRFSTSEFIEKAKKIHGNKYNYKNVIYKNNNTPVSIICRVHGEFKQTPNDHTDGKSGCDKCYLESKPFSQEYFINEAIIIHGTKYLYDLVEYKSIRVKVKIICSKHGIFEQRPDLHLLGHGCPICNESKGEKAIALFLTANNILFDKQKTFDGCKYKNKLYFDFFLPKHNTCIEYDGKQHYEPIEYFGGRDGLKTIKIRDKVKNEYCKKHNICLLRITYRDNTIKILRRFFMIK